MAMAMSKWKRTRFARLPDSKQLLLWCALWGSGKLLENRAEKREQQNMAGSHVSIAYLARSPLTTPARSSRASVSRSVDRIEFSMMRMHLVVSLMPRRSSSPDLWCFRFSLLWRAAPPAASACRTNHANFEQKKTFLALSVFGRWFGFSIFFYLIFVCWIRWMGMERVMRRSAMDFPFYLILCNQMLLADCPVSDTMAKRGNFSERPKTLNIGN